MRTLQEKYNAILEGNFSEAQFVRDARLAHPSLITQYNGFNDTVQILKNKGMIAEVAKKQEPKYSTENQKMQSHQMYLIQVSNLSLTRSSAL